MGYIFDDVSSVDINNNSNLRMSHEDYLQTKRQILNFADSSARDELLSDLENVYEAQKRQYYGHEAVEIDSLLQGIDMSNPVPQDDSFTR